MQGGETLRPIVGKIVPHTPAAVAGLQVGDEITAVDGKAIQDWEDINYALIDRMGESGDLRLSLRATESRPARELSLKLSHFLGGKDVDPLREVGFLPWQPALEPVIGEVMADGVAAQQG